MLFYFGAVHLHRNNTVTAHPAEKGVNIWIFFHGLTCLFLMLLLI